MDSTLLVALLDLSSLPGPLLPLDVFEQFNSHVLSVSLELP